MINCNQLKEAHRIELIESIEQLSYSTIRIEAKTESGTTTGSGFCYRIAEDMQPGQWIPYLITNKHVIEGAIEIRLTASTSIENEKVVDKDIFSIVLTGKEVSNNITYHPDENIDLCGINLFILIKKARDLKKEVALYYIGMAEKFSRNELEKLDAFEDVIMIGYPNGIWDQINNKPIIRNGCTASHPKKDYNGKSEIMINIPSFPGSSGSPVFYKSYDGIRQDKNGLILSPHLKIRLLGILYAGPIFNHQGEVEMSSNALTITTNSPSTMNLGLIIKAEKLKELEEEIIKESFI